jgi:hypothetical protein
VQKRTRLLTDVAIGDGNIRGPLGRPYVFAELSALVEIVNLIGLSRSAIAARRVQPGINPAEGGLPAPKGCCVGAGGQGQYGSAQVDQMHVGGWISDDGSEFNRCLFDDDEEVEDGRKGRVRRERATTYSLILTIPSILYPLVICHSEGLSDDMVHGFEQAWMA